jgi:hypothetical protein
MGGVAMALAIIRLLIIERTTLIQVSVVGIVLS